MPGTNDAALYKALEALPVANFRAGEPVLTAGSKTGRLLILKSGSVAILKGSIELAKVDEPGAVIGELSALLDWPHTADVKALAGYGKKGFGERFFYTSSRDDESDEL
jgi:CRP/FNR family transcriptional regulator, cyclic AMP receptor protein